jgi:hypothetical protein
VVKEGFEAACVDNATEFIDFMAVDLSENNTNPLKQTLKISPSKA